MATEFSSEGFDLDSAADDVNVVLEVGGGATKLESDTEKTQEETQSESISETSKSEEYKALGNDSFKKGAYLEAYDMYTEAVEACPGMTGDQLLKEKDQFDQNQRDVAMEQQRKFDDERRTRTTQDEDQPERPPPLEPYKAPMHVYGDKLAVYHCNRAAVCLHLARYEQAIRDCDIAVLLNPTYTKAWMRRSTAHERTEQIEDALRDSKMAQQLDPNNANVNKTVKRLQKLEDERMEKLKEETMGKLKDLGNSLLGNFGLSLDNFQATQGSDGNYSVSFNK